MCRLGRISYALLFSFAIFAALSWLWQQVSIHHDKPPLWLIGLALGSLALSARRIPTIVWLWWVLGLVTVFWSLTPSNTLVLGLWELAYLAAFGAGTWLAGLLSLNIALLAYGLFTTLALASAGMIMYFSGSAHYVSGAQALVLVPVAAALMFRSRWPILSGLLLTGALYLALMSGARAVYLPLVLVLTLSVYRLWREQINLPRIFAGLGLVALIVFSVDAALPFQPIRTALDTRTSIEKQISDASTEGSFGSRLQMWRQTLSIALQEPLGTGNGSFREVLAAYQQYPGVLFSSAHNYYLETAATGGWPRLIVLLGLLVWILWRGWNSKAWPWALGAAGLWATLAFDITGMYPAVMMLAFASLGAVYRQLEHKPIPTKTHLLWRVPFLIIAMGLAVWWYWPCQSSCAVTRHLGYRPEVLAEAARLSGEEQKALLARAAELNPKSIWVRRAQLQYAESPQERLEALRTINQQFPLAGPWFYLQRAEVTIELGLKPEAIEALRAGLERFPPNFKPAGIPLGDAVYKQYEEWGQKAPVLLRQLEAQ